MTLATVSGWMKTAALTLGLALSACGQGAPPEPGPTERTPSPVAAGDDKTVDRLRRTLAPRLSRSLSDLPAEPRAGGGRRIALSGRMSSMHVVQKRADGSFEVGCVTSPRQLDARLVRAEAAR